MDLTVLLAHHHPLAGDEVIRSKASNAENYLGVRQNQSDIICHILKCFASCSVTQIILVKMESGVHFHAENGHIYV